MPFRFRPHVMALCVLLSVGCGGKRATYPAGATIQFQVACVRQLWPGSANAPLDVREAFCGCIVRRCEQRYDAEEFDRFRLALDEAGYRLDSPSVPADFRALAIECRTAVDRGDVAVE